MIRGHDNSDPGHDDGDPGVTMVTWGRDGDPGVMTMVTRGHDGDLGSLLYRPKHEAGGSLLCGHGGLPVCKLCENKQIFKLIFHSRK